MSEHQIVAFRAIDGPVSENNLTYMRRQSSRAEVTPLSFDNEYHFGDFRGDAGEMLRRGYDLHLHYANFGIRNLMIRLPHGLPDPAASKGYFEEDSLQFLKDKQGPGGILSIDPYHEPGDLEELWEFGELIDRLVPLRAEILEGDLRPLYLAHLAMARDGNHDPKSEREAPVPAGLENLTDAQHALMEFYGLDKALIVAAARNAPSLPVGSDARREYAEWLKHQPEAKKNAWLADLMADSHSTVRREVLGEFHASRNTPSWPTIRLNRTIAELEAAAADIKNEASRHAAAKAASDRVKMIADMAADPKRTIRETEALVDLRSVDSYRQIATLLANLREALAGSDQSGLAEQQAIKLRKNHPTLHKLTSELRRQGFLQK